MTSASRIALLGFSRFERATFESFFRIAAKRTPSYTYVDDLAQADFVVADADDTKLAAQTAEPRQLARTLMLGATPRPGCAVQLARPINLMLVVRALDALPRGGPAETAAKPAAAQETPQQLSTSSQSARRVLQDLATRTAALAPNMDVRALAGTAAPSPTTSPVSAPPPTRPVAQPVPHAQLPELPSIQTSAPKIDHILVVDDSDIALRFMANHLQRFGFQIHLARSGEDAIQRVAQRHFEFVFLDVMMEGLDGFQTCKAIKRSTYCGDRPPPTVVMLSGRGTAIDKLRGTMAGCDAYLTKPLREADLLKVVGDREIAQHAYAETAHLTTTML